MFMILFWVLVIVAIVLIVRYVARTSGNQGQAEAPLDILKRRYAKGELTKEQFDTMKEDLKG